MAVLPKTKKSAHEMVTSASASQIEAATELLEISTGSIIATLIPFKILLSHLISENIVSKDAIIAELKKGLNTDLYSKNIQNMINPIWTSLQNEIEK